MLDALKEHLNCFDGVVFGLGEPTPTDVRAWQEMFKEIEQEHRVIEERVEILERNIDHIGYRSHKTMINLRENIGETLLLKRKYELLEKKVNLFKNTVIDFRTIDPPKALDIFITQCKEIKGLKLYLKREPTTYRLLVETSKLNFENEAIFFDLYAELRIKAIEYKFNVFIIPPDCTPEGAERLI